MPFDLASILVIVAASALFAVAAFVSKSIALRVSLVLLAALLIRLDASWQHDLHEWDEKYHALVAKNLASDPLKPTLYRRPLIEYDYRHWYNNHVWLHKPPGALWLMAGSMRTFGINALAMRLPSLLMSTAAVVLTFLIGSLLWNRRVGLLGASFHAVNGFLVALAAGRRVADHVDAALIFFVELGILMALLHMRKRSAITLVGAGLALGAGLLSKSAPALLVVIVAFAMFIQQEMWWRALFRATAILIVGILLLVPWTFYTWTMFPNEAAWSQQYMLMHIGQNLETQRADAFTYLRDLPRFFGELVWIPLIGFAVLMFRTDDANRRFAWIVVWMLVPYIAFSMAGTRMPSYVMIAAPALFLMQAYFWCWLRDRYDRIAVPWRRAIVGLVLAVLVLLPARYLLEPTNVFERRDRDPARTRELRSLESRLQLPDAAIFNMPFAIEAMFYTPYTVYDHMPTAEQVRDITARGIPVVIYQQPGVSLAIPDDWPVILLSDLSSR